MYIYLHIQHTVYIYIHIYINMYIYYTKTHTYMAVINITTRAALHLYYHTINYKAFLFCHIYKPFHCLKISQVLDDEKLTFSQHFSLPHLHLYFFLFKFDIKNNGNVKFTCQRFDFLLHKTRIFKF